MKLYETTHEDFLALRALHGGGPPPFALSTRLDDAGNDVPCLVFVFADQEIYNPRLSECGRFSISPAYYGIAENEARYMEVMNKALHAYFYAE